MVPFSVGFLGAALFINFYSLLTSQFFTTKPFACDPSSLPKYPPSKEIDAKLRDEEARRYFLFG